MVNPEPQHSGSGTQERMVATPRVVTRVDDLDGSGDAHTVRVGLDGQAYEIDLTDAHAHHSARCWPPYVSAGGASPGAVAHTPAPTSTPEPPGRDGAFTVGAADQQDGNNAIICRVEDVRSCRVEDVLSRPPQRG
jgi:hypothetical protein